MISIIVPIYNAEKSLSKCIESLLAQKYRDIQIILVNDGSKDMSAQICKEYAQRDSRIKYIEKENGGVSSARNTGLSEADGDYIAFVDADDCVLANTYELLFQSINVSQTDLVICGYTRIDENGNNDYILKSDCVSGKSEIAQYVAVHYNSGYICSPCNKLYKRKYITKSFPAEISLGEDLLFNLQYFGNINSVKIMDVPLYLYYGYNENSLTSGYKESYFDDIRTVCEEAKKYLSAAGLGEKDFLHINYKLVYSALHFMLEDVQRNDKQYALSRIKAYCSEPALYEASHKISGENGRLMGVCAWFIRRKCIHVLYLICKIRIFIKGRNAKKLNALHEENV